MREQYKEVEHTIVINESFITFFKNEQPEVHHL
jgi:hypothetical protein